MINGWQEVIGFEPGGGHAPFATPRSDRLVRDDGRGPPGGSCPGLIPDNCTLSSLSSAKYSTHATAASKGENVDHCSRPRRLRSFAVSAGMVPASACGSAACWCAVMSVSQCCCAHSLPGGVPTPGDETAGRLPAALAIKLAVLIMVFPAAVRVDLATGRVWASSAAIAGGSMSSRHVEHAELDMHRWADRSPSHHHRPKA